MNKKQKHKYRSRYHEKGIEYENYQLGLSHPTPEGRVLTREEIEDWAKAHGFPVKAPKATAG